MPSFRFVLPTLIRDEVNQGFRFFDVWELVPEWAEDKIGQHIYYAFSDDVPVFPISEPGVPDKFTPEEVAKAWSAIMYVGVLGNRHELAQKRREWQLELNKREDVPDRYKKTEAEIMEQYNKDLWYVPPSIFDQRPAAEPRVDNQTKEVPPAPVDPEANPAPPVHIPSNDELKEAMRLEEEAKKEKQKEEKQESSEESSSPVVVEEKEESNPQPEAVDHSEDETPEVKEDDSPSENKESSPEESAVSAEETPTSPESEEPQEDSQPESSNEEDTPAPPRPKAALATWRKYAEKIGVEVDKSLSRDEIVEYIKSVRPELFKESE
nr:MAG TPA: hypothetical protein [Caudoviricetes sp.]